MIVIAFALNTLLATVIIDQSECSNRDLLGTAWELSLLFSLATVILCFIRRMKGWLWVLTCLSCLTFHPGLFAIQNAKVGGDCGAYLSKFAIAITTGTLISLLFQTSLFIREQMRKSSAV